MSAAAVAGASAEGRPQTAEGELAGGRGDTDNDIKDYAETTMNELLGWYGYDKLDTRNLRRHSSSSSSSTPTRPEEDASEEDTSASPENDYTSTSAGGGGGAIVCAWCLKMGLKLFTLKTFSGETKEFCSETCFNQCRRAAFKKNRVCNWCRHVRHTVNYVDFQDGDDQLQFCSDKCLNQYKMQIFCRETQAYLQMNPHLLQEEAGKGNPAGSNKLITPDLWLRDCHEPSNGAVSSSDGDELHHSRPGDKPELEDLSTAPKSEHCSPPTNHAFHRDREAPKNVSSRDSLSEKCDALFASFRDEERDRTERRKRHHEIGREGYRKRQRIPPFRNKLSEIPPAHASSTASSLGFPKHGPLFPSTSFPLPLRSKSPVHASPPAAHSKSFTPHPGMTTNPVLHPGLPPPPPLLNNDYYHPPFNPQMFTPHQQQLDAVLRMQAGLAPNSGFSPNFFHDSMLPLLRGTSAQQKASAAIPQPSTVMLPFPIFVPLPVPIPIPLPLRSFLPKEMQTEEPKTPKEREYGVETPNSKGAEDEAKNSKTDVVCEDASSVVTGSRNLGTATDSDLSEKMTRRHKKR